MEENLSLSLRATNGSAAIQAFFLGVKVFPGLPRRYAPRNDDKGDKSKMLKRYIWEQENWPHFKYDLSGMQDILYRYAMETRALFTPFSQFSDELQKETAIDLMVSEAIKTSAIEGETFNTEEVRSSIRKELNLPYQGELLKDPRAGSLAKLMLSIRQTYGQPLSKESLFEWHKMIIFDARLDIGKWRCDAEPVQIISGPIGHEIVHFEAPPSKIIPQEMDRFITWFNQTDPTISQEPLPGPVRAAIAHLYFECIHPFSDGNGRIGRAICEKALSQELKMPVLLSLSTRIEKERKTYYNQLSNASQNGLNITKWITYFVQTIAQAQEDAKEQINFVLQKSKFWKQHASNLNKRQEKVLSRMLREGPSGFEGGAFSFKIYGHFQLF